MDGTLEVDGRASARLQRLLFGAGITQAISVITALVIPDLLTASSVHGGNAGGPTPPGGGSGSGAARAVPILFCGAAFGAAGLGAAGTGSLGATDLTAETGLGVTGEEAVAVGPDGMVGSAAASDAAGSETAAVGEGTGMPMADGGGGSRERMRESWLPEDPTVWDNQTESVPSTIGA